MQQPKYRFYATLLDSFQWYLNSESEDSFKEFIDKINRVPYERSTEALKGLAFNKILDDDTIIQFDGKVVKFDGFEFDTLLLNEFKDYFRGAAKQVWVNANLETNMGLIELGGYQDYIKMDYIFDLKTTKSYEFPKFMGNWQHKVYPYCMLKNGNNCPIFEYTVTDFKSIFKEQYIYRPEVDEQSLKNICERLANFLETNRHLITDKKIFNLK